MELDMLTTAPSANTYLLPETVCEIVPGMTESALAQLRYRGTGPKFLKPTPRTVLYRYQDVIDWIEGSEQTITSRSGE